MLAIKNAVLVMRDHLIPDAVLFIENGKIAGFGEMRKTSIPEDCEIIDAKGAFVGPGLIDIHTHSDGKTFFYENPKVVAHHLQHGVTTILAALYFSMTTEEFVEAMGIIRKAMEDHMAEDGPEHMVQPGMVYISFSSEVGTVYSLDQLKSISAVCREYGFPLFIDGARMGYGLASEGCDVSLSDIASLADVFYIGGTKQGALFGEAVVIVNDALKKDFRYNIKQNGGMLAKGRLLGIQFLTQAFLRSVLYYI